MMLVQFSVDDPETPAAWKWEAGLEHLPRVGDNLTFADDERNDGEPVEYTVKRATWHISGGGAEGHVVLTA